MPKIVTEAEISRDGWLYVKVPTGLPPGKVKVTLSIEPQEEQEQVQASLEGRWRDKFPPDVDLDAILREIRHAWEAEWRINSYL